MQIQKITRSKNDNYTTLCNVALRDKRLSLKAKGFFALVMSLPPDWDFSIAGMEAILQEGKHSIYACLKELIELGYVKRERRYENGKVAEWSYVFNEKPSATGAEAEVNLLPENLEVENLELENLVVENPPQISKEVNKERTKEVKRDAPAKNVETFGSNTLVEKTEQVMRIELDVYSQDRIIDVVPVEFEADWLELVKNRMMGRTDHARSTLTKNLGYWLGDFQKDLPRLKKTKAMTQPTPVVGFDVHAKEAEYIQKLQMKRKVGVFDGN